MQSSVHFICLSFLCSTVPVLAVKKDAVEVTNYFPGVKGDLSTITWAHAVNSRQDLWKTLDDDGVMMLECDVLMGTVIGGNSSLYPILAHPPHVTSDITVEQLIDEVIAADRHKGIKLDFKHDDVVEQSMKILAARTQKINFPLWLNADILPGPVNSVEVPLNASHFLLITKHYFPFSMLSLGWKTRLVNELDLPGEYSAQQVNAMIEVFQQNEITQPVTFPVRAGIAAYSTEALYILVSKIPGSTLTLWSAKSDKVNVEKLMQLIEKIGRNRVYVDVPDFLTEQLNARNFAVLIECHDSVLIFIATAYSILISYSTNSQLL